jgi:hypothetical protein
MATTKIKKFSKLLLYFYYALLVIGVILSIHVLLLFRKSFYLKKFTITGRDGISTVVRILQGDIFIIVLLEILISSGIIALGLGGIKTFKPIVRDNNIPKCNCNLENSSGKIAERKG